MKFLAQLSRNTCELIQITLISNCFLKQNTKIKLKELSPPLVEYLPFRVPSIPQQTLKVAFPCHSLRAVLCESPRSCGGAAPSVRFSVPYQSLGTRHATFRIRLPRARTRGQHRSRVLVSRRPTWRPGGGEVPSPKLTGCSPGSCSALPLFTSSCGIQVRLKSRTLAP